MRLFDRGEHGEIQAFEDADNGEVEHGARPVPTKAEPRLPTLILSFEDEGSRDALVTDLGLVVERRGDQWLTWWPDAPESDALTLFDA